VKLSYLVISRVVIKVVL